MLDLGVSPFDFNLEILNLHMQSLSFNDRSTPNRDLEILLLHHKSRKGLSHKRQFTLA